MISCNAEGKNNKKIPTKAFVKVYKTLEVLKCKKGKKCVTGRWVSTGSGISVNIYKDNNVVLTAGHLCVEGLAKNINPNVEKYQMVLHVMDYEKTVHQGHIILSSLDDSSGKIDACALFVPSLTGEKVSVSGSPPVVGQRVISMGAPAGVYHPPTVLIVDGIYSGDIDESSSLTSIPATGGSSGSGVLNKNHQLIGILYAVNLRFRHASVITNYNSTIKFIKKVTSLLEAKEAPRKEKN